MFTVSPVSLSLCCNRTLDTLVKSVDDHASDTGSTAVQHMQGVCSDQMLKRQLQSLKASFINLGQKESFAEGGCRCGRQLSSQF